MKAKASAGHIMLKTPNLSHAHTHRFSSRSRPPPSPPPLPPRPRPPRLLPRRLAPRRLRPFSAPPPARLPRPPPPSSARPSRDSSRSPPPRYLAITLSYGYDLATESILSGVHLGYSLVIVCAVWQGNPSLSCPRNCYSLNIAHSLATESTSIVPTHQLLSRGRVCVCTAPQ